LCMKRGCFRSAGGAVVGRRFSSGGLVELSLLVHPREGWRAGASSEGQAHEVYGHLGRALSELGAQPADVLTQRLYLGDVGADAQVVLAQSEGFYGPGPGPATSLIGQPPLDPPGACNLLAFCVFPEERGAAPELSVESWPSLSPPTSGKVVRWGGRQQVFLHNLVAEGGSFREQTQAVFARAVEALKVVGLTIHDVLRTWIYLGDIERDYQELNELRNDFFRRQGISGLPASTGIEGYPHPGRALIMLELYGFRSPEGLAIRPLQTAGMNEAPEYGSAFTRGLLVRDGGQVTGLISGTASIDDRGDTVRVGDSRGQMERALENFSGLLADGGLGSEDILWAVTYLKEPGILPALQEELASRKLPSFPHQVVKGRLCRPEFLGEIEATARSFAPGT